MFENLRLAFVEDNNDTRNVLSHLLEKRGFVVTQFSNGETASIEIPKLCPHVAIIDIGLPGKNGFELVQEIRKHENCKDMLVIALSGHGRESDQVDANRSGIDALLIKPTQINTLCELIASKLVR